MKTRRECIFGAAAGVRRAIAAACRGCGRDVAGVRVVAAAKTFSADDVRVVAECGFLDVGENYVQEARGKILACAGLPVVWHYLGRVQSNKAAVVARLFDVVHSVDSVGVARRLSAARGNVKGESEGKPLMVFVQVNIDGEESKGGVSAAGAESFIKEIVAMPYLHIKGLMCMPRRAGNARDAFAGLRCLRDGINDRLGLQMDGLSMGMSGDYGDAIAEGATHLRLGTALFGARAAKVY